MPRTPREPFICPNCGADVPAKALSCPNCGSDEETGWSEEARYVHLLPDQEEFKPSRPNLWRSWGIPLVGGVLLIVTVVSMNGLLLVGLLPVLVLVGLAYFAMTRLGIVDRFQENQAYTRLLQQARGDRDLAERLIAYERNRRPDATRLQHIEDAISRWQRDRR
jgi:predicted RNA-binding Zn-ribbon protein involved in translation (DUF1610 family)